MALGSSTQDIAVSFAIALVAGILIGLEREQANAAPGSDDDAGDSGPRSALGGVRTFPLIALGGAAASVIAGSSASWLPAAGLIGLTILLASVRTRTPGATGVTSEVAALLLWMLGSLAGSTDVFADNKDKAITVVGIAVVAASLLSIKVPLHSFVRKLSNQDVFSTLQLLLVAVVILPLLPDQTFGPYDVLNPAQVGRMVALIAGISFVGYIASRAYGAGRGMLVTGLVGGLASSTAVTFAMARRARADNTLATSGALGVVLASTIMLARVVIEVAVVHPPLVSEVLVPMVAMGVAALIGATVLWRRSRGRGQGAPEQVELKNPMELKSALFFGLLFALVLFLTKVASKEAGPAALYLTAALAGATDVDAITLSAANLARAGTAPAVATAAILVAVASNTLVKAGIALFVGGRAIGARVGLVFLAMIVAGAVGVATLFFADVDELWSCALGVRTASQPGCQSARRNR